MSKSFFLGPLLIIFCMLLRATDIIFRSKSLASISPIEIITLEHLIAVIALSPLLIKKFKLVKLNSTELFFMLFIAFGSSVGGILCFTAAFKYINPAIVILLQKLQPIITILFSIIILKEKISKGFYFWAVMAIISAYILVFEFSIPKLSFGSNNLLGVILSLGAVFLWASGTVFGKVLLKKMDYITLTHYRYVLGLLFSLFLLSLSMPHLSIFTHPKLLINISYMALIPGLLALYLYYKGLNTTRASISSILELFFPIASVALAWIVLKHPLSMLQLKAAFMLLLSIIAISTLNTKTSN